MQHPVTFYIDGDGIVLNDPRKGYCGKYYEKNGKTVLGWLWQKYDRKEVVKIVLYKKKGDRKVITQFFEFKSNKFFQYQ